MSTTKDFQVTIIGGGVCGLACAIALQKAGLSVDLFEAAGAFGEIGAGIGLGSNAIHALKAMGLFDAVLAKINPASFRLGVFCSIQALEPMNSSTKYAHPTIFVQRCSNPSYHYAVFLDALVGLIDPKSVHFKKRCTSVAPSATDPDRVIVTFADGTSHETDLVLGADGVRSKVRDFVVGASEPQRVVFSNAVAYRGLVPHAVLKQAGFKTTLTDRPACFIGPDRHMIVTPLKNGELVNVAAVTARYDVPMEAWAPDTPWTADVPRAEVQEAYAAWGSDALTLLACLPEKVLKFSMHVVHPPLESYARARVAILGDAAHGMLPHLGAGAGQGIEDALLLFRLLTHAQTKKENLPAVLTAYSHVRRPRSQDVWEGSKRAGMIYHLRGPSGATHEGIRKDIVSGMWQTVWNYDIDSDIVRAVEHLQASGTFAA
ncbi:salicylate hydroxylase [Epithele typhae]|uniref:salicylate hydroxylase n=1 Tax=Epithele typhae TaxID=378194 RepID=UPI0020074C79|nr:salicylate hydroxylase [Epithele typhae]KAH9913314.1 salicylate hydroxylase [Epithele typhae]